MLVAPTASPSPAPSGPIEVAQSHLETMLRTGHADPAWFSASFLAQIPASKVDGIVADLTKALGAYARVEFTPEKFVAHFAKGTDDVLIHLDDQYKIDGLFFRPPVVTTSSVDDLLKGLRPASGTLSYVIAVEGRSERAALNASEPLAVGSAFKLAVLNALQDEVRAGARRWSDVVPLRTQWKSIPSGVLQTWPTGSPITIGTYATEMISISDNTAADALAHVVGAQALKPYAGSNDPFLTTRQMSVLKSQPGTALRAAYAAAKTPAERRAVLNRTEAIAVPRVEEFLAAPNLAIEWHYTVRDLCAMMRRVADLPLMSVNPGLADAHAFRHVAYKGGSDAGVLNMTTVVTTTRGTRICFAATVNDAAKAVDESAFSLAYRSVLRAMEQW